MSTTARHVLTTSHIPVNKHTVVVPTNTWADGGDKNLGLAKSTAILSIFLAVLLLLILLLFSVMVFVHLHWRQHQWIKVLKILQERLVMQVMTEEKLVKVCETIKFAPEIIHKERDDICPNVEKAPLTPTPGNTVDPFRCPSNMYDQILESDNNFSNYKTLRDIDADIFVNKNDLNEIKQMQSKKSTKPVTQTQAAPSQVKPQSPASPQTKANVAAKNTEKKTKEQKDQPPSVFLV